MFAYLPLGSYPHDKNASDREDRDTRGIMAALLSLATNSAANASVEPTVSLMDVILTIDVKFVFKWNYFHILACL